MLQLKLGLKQVSDDGALFVLIIDEILAANADKVAEYKLEKRRCFAF